MSTWKDSQRKGLLYPYEFGDYDYMSYTIFTLSQRDFNPGFMENESLKRYRFLCYHPSANFNENAFWVD
jgi:hypothetical protein